MRLILETDRNTQGVRVSQRRKADNEEYRSKKTGLGKKVKAKRITR